MKNRLIALLLALSVLASTSCGMVPQAGEDPKLSTEKDPHPQNNVTIHVVEEDEENEENTDLQSSDETPEETEIPEAPEETELVWCTEPVLKENEMPGSYQGLELPVAGATGYTSTILPLWASLENYEAYHQAAAAWQQYQTALTEALEAESARAAANDGGMIVSPSEPVPEPTSTVTVPVPSARIRLLSAGGDESIEPDPVEPSDVEPEPVPVEEEVPPSVDETPQETETPVFPSDSGEPEPEDSEQSQPSTEMETEPIESDTLPALPELEPEPTPEPEPESVPLPTPPEGLLQEPTMANYALAILPAGTAMTVLREEGDWWQVSCEAAYFTSNGGTAVGEITGWVTHRYCLINLPDVIPSIVYNATNAYSSVFRTCGMEIEGITGQQLYSGPARNRRLGQVEFMMPVLYSMAPHLCAAQQAALREGNTLVLYEGYRPKETQLKVAGAVEKLMKQAPEIKTALNTKPWSISWFIATSTSNHQWGYAVDVNLARVSSVDVYKTGNYAFTRVTGYEEYTMPTPIHELSPAAAIFKEAIGSNSKTAWKSATRTESFAACESALGLQAYCTGAGLSPLASEWWHFNDLDSRASVLDNLGKGDFEITVCRSVAPW